jgi:glycerol kinase
VVTIDAGTTGVRAMALDESGEVVALSYSELPQHFPRGGWVEHDASDIWDLVSVTVAEVVDQVGGAVAAVGITNQRETVVAWDRKTGRPRHHAIVWQDRRTAARCAELREAGHLGLVRERTGLVLDPYFSATKMEWLLGPGGVEVDADLALGTVDSWVLWNLTGGPAGGVFATDPSNASRTMLFDIRRRRWDEELVALFGIPTHALAEVLPTSGRFGLSAPGGPLPAGTPISGIAGDQQSALFGQACFSAGMAKNTYGTGSFVLMNAGAECPDPVEGLLTSVAWELSGPSSQLAYALEGSVFVTGAAIQWLRDGLGIIGEAAQAGPLAASIPDTEGVYFVPALAGLGSPWWDPDARGAVVGLTRGTGRAHLTRAAIEAMAFQTRDVVDAMGPAVGHGVHSLRVDGGAAVMDLLLQIQADQLQAPVARPKMLETTAIGAAWLAGLAEGVWGSLDELASLWSLDVEIAPVITQGGADARHRGWLRAVERARGWAAS